MEFLVEFEINIPNGTPLSEVKDREAAEAAAAAKLAGEGHLVRVWKGLVASGETKILGLYRAESTTEVNSLLGGLPLADWMHITVTPLESHPNDPGAGGDRRAATGQLPAPRLTLIYRLDITLGEPMDFGPTA